MPILETIVAHRPEIFVFLGDNIYGDTTDMDVMRAKYSLLANDAGFQKLRKTCRVLATWDDHDYGGNDAGADYSMRVASQKLFVDFWKDPINSARRKRAGIYDARVFGPPEQRVQIILLDTRYFRSPLKKGPKRVGGPYVPDPDPKLTMLGEAQWKWLEQQLLEPARIRILATSIQCLAEDAGQETWSNLPHERARLLKLVRQTRAGGLIMVSGDRHWSELSQLSEQMPYPIYDLTSSSLNQLHARGTPTENKYRLLPKTYHRENFGEIHIDWSKADPELALRIRDIKGTVQLQQTLRLSDLSPTN